MSSVEEVTKLLQQWEEQNTANQDVTATLMKLADIFEHETEAFLKKDPDPFDDRHPSRLQPDCTFGHMLKTVFRNERIVDHMVKVYCQRDVVDLNTASLRLLLDILPGLESVVFQEEGFVPRLLHWAEKAPNPLQSYATGLLAAAMDVPEIATNYREKNAYFVPLMLRRLHTLSQKYLQNPPSLDEAHIPERPFAFLGGTYDEKSTNSLDESSRNNSRKSSKKRKDGARSLRYSPFPPESKIGVRKSNVKNSPAKHCLNFNDGSNSNWSELEHYVIGSNQVYPLTLAAEQRYILQYLTPMGEYQDLLGHIFEENALPLILQYIDLRQNPDVRLAFEALKYLASLLCHKKITIEFLNIGGLQLLLKVPFPSIAATGVSICLYYLSYIEEAMEKICLLPSAVISELVHYALWLLECSHDSSRCHATMFFGYAFAFRIILEHFDMQDGLRKLFNVMSTLDIFVLNINNSRTLSDDQIFANRQTTRHVCGALKRYFEGHLVAEIDKQVSSTRKMDHPKTQSKHYKAVNLSYESIEGYMDMWREILLPNYPWKPVEEFLNLEGVMFLLDLITSYFELSYSGRAETVKNALDVLKICSLTSMTQLMFCERVSSQEYFNITGILVLLQAADGELMPMPDIQRSALHTIINCVCTRIPSQEKTGNNDSKADCSSKNSSTPRKKAQRSIEDTLNKLWKSVRIKNGIIILINLLSIKTPLTDADSIRALACQALCGLARSETVKQIISKLPLITEGQLFDLMKEPVLQDKGHDHVQFCKFGLELLERVTGAPVSDGSESSMLNINKSEIVAKTKVVYNDAQLLQLISDHLSTKGLSETVACLQKEMTDKSLLPPVVTTYCFYTPSKPTPNVSSSVLRNYRNNDVYSSPSSLNTTMSVNTIPPPSVPLKIVVNKKIQISDQKPTTPSRLQKQQTCSGNYVQTPAMKRQGANGYLFGDPQSSISLDSIVTEYLRKQHALCKNPVLACPPFDLFVPHKCPEPKHKRNAPVNCVLRIHKKQMSDQNGGFGGAALDRKFIYSKFRLVKSFRDEDGRFDYVCNSFQNFNVESKPRPKILIGTSGNIGNSVGRMKVYNINSGDEETCRDGHQRGVSHIESSKFNSLIITSDNGRIGNSALWKAEDNFDVIHNFNEIQHLEFGKRTASRAVGTKHDSAVIIDTATCAQLQEFPSGDLGNNYAGNRATFDYSDEFILSDGLIFDVRSKDMVHKLDKFNANFNGVFHPNGREIISNTEIWDLRTFKLLRTVVGLDQCKVVFNQPGSIIYGVYCNREQPDEKTNCFYTFNAYDYSPIATVDVKRPVFHLSVDQHDKYIATIESQFAISADQFLPPVNGVECVCRLYEIGRTKKEGDEDGEESDDSEEESDDDDELDDDENDEGQNDEDAMFEIEGDDDSSDTSDEDDETLFSLNTSMED